MRTTSLLKVGACEVGGGGATARCRAAPMVTSASSAKETILRLVRMATSQLCTAKDLIDPGPPGGADLPSVDGTHVDASSHAMKKRSEAEKGAREVHLNRMGSCIALGNRARHDVDSHSQMLRIGKVEGAVEQRLDGPAK